MGADEVGRHQLGSGGGPEVPEGGRWIRPPKRDAADSSGEAQIAKLKLKLAQQHMAYLAAALLMWTGARRSTIRQLRINQDIYRSRNETCSDVILFDPVEAGVRHEPFEVSKVNRPQTVNPITGNFPFLLHRPRPGNCGGQDRLDSTYRDAEEGCAA